jgi:ABC-type branched-subunit amino acid transport system substrate-binding protein
VLWSVNDPRERQASGALVLLRRRLEEAGLAVVMQRGVANRADDVAATVSELSRSRAELAVFVGDADEAAALSQALKALPTPPTLLLAPWSTEPRYLSLAAGAAESVLYLSLVPDPAPTGEFYQRYRQLALASALDVEPGPEGALAYAATVVLFEAAQAAWQEQAVDDRGDVASAVRRSDGFETIVGRLSFDERGWRQPLALYLRQVSRLRYGGATLAETAVTP